jgi:dimethylglycine dehydrogenase
MSAIHDDLAAAGACFGAVYGWERPNWFAPAGSRPDAVLSFGRTNWFEAVGEECAAASERAALADLSAFSKFEIAGPDAFDFVDTLGANRAPARDGRIVLTHALTPRGGVASEFTVTRLAADRFYLTSAAAARRHDDDLLRRHGRAFTDLAVTDRALELGVLGLMGPQAEALLAGLAEAEVSAGAFPWLTAQEIEVAGLPVRALRVSYIGESGWELHVAMAHLKPLYDAILQAGKALGLGHYGAFAMNALRLEKGYRAWGADLSTERTPLEAGLGRLVKPDGRRFTGREALLEAGAKSPYFRMELLEIGGDGPDPFGLHPVFAGGQVAGLTTSGAYGHRTGKKLALAYLKPAALTAGAPLSVEICGLPQTARILEAAPYDPQNRRLIAG